MLKKYQDLTVYESQKSTDLDPTLVNQADIVIIHEYVPGGIYGPYKMFWVGQLPESDDPYCLINSHRERKGLIKSQEYLKENGYAIETLPGTPELFEEFNHLYESTTATKDRFQKIDLTERILTKIKGGIPTFFSVLKEGRKLHSALVFYIQSNQVFVTVGAKQRMDALRGGTGGVLEIELVRFCIEHNIKTIFHGKNKNPIGLFNKIGQFTFKTRYGYTAYPQDHWCTFFLQNPSVGLSDWLFLTPHNDKLCYVVLSETLATHPPNEFTSQTDITVITLDSNQIAKDHRQALKSVLQTNYET